MSSPRTSGRAALAVLCFAILYLPLEEFVLKWAPGGSAGYAAARLGLEACLFASVAALAAGRAARGLRRRSTPLDGPLLLFLALALGSLALSDGSWLAGAVNLRVLLRYIAAFYLAAYLDLAPHERRRVLVLLLVSGALQGALGIVQYAQGGAGEFWLPRSDLTAVGGVTKDFAALSGGLEQGAVLGTTDHSIAFALFLLVAGTLAGALHLSGAVRGGASVLLLAVLALAFAGIVFSYVRSCLFALVLTLGFLAWHERRGAPLRRLFPGLLVLSPLALAGIAALFAGEAAFVREKETHVGPLASVEALFTSEYVQSAESSRLWVLKEVGSEIARSAGWLGFGPDQEHVKARLLQTGGAALHRLIAYRAFEDVYWVALLAYYGFLGAAVFLFVLARLLPLARGALGAEDPWDRAAALTLLSLLLVLVPLGFLAPTLDFRTFAFPFWLLAGMAAGRQVPASGRAPAARAAPLALPGLA